jgi:hypothetical protein
MDAGLGKPVLKIFAATLSKLMDCRLPVSVASADYQGGSFPHEQSIDAD